jgi:hypothetical protein
VNPQFPEIGWDVQEQVQPNDHNHGIQHPLFDLEEEQDQVMEVEVQMQEQQQDAIPEQPMEQDIHQFNDSAIIDSSSSEGSVNMLHIPQQLVINRIEVQFEVLGKDVISFLDKQFPSYANCMNTVMVGPVLPKDMLMDKVYKGLIPAIFLNAIPPAIPALKFAWLTEGRSLFSDTVSISEGSMVTDTSPIKEGDVVLEPATGKEIVRKRKHLVPTSSRVTRSALKPQVHIQKQDRKKHSKRNSFNAISLFTEEVDSSSWTDSSVRRCTRHMAKANGYKFESMPDKGTARKKPKSSKSVDAEEEEVVPFIPVSTLQHIGRQLEIPEEEITAEKLMADPVDPKKKKSSNAI